MSFTKVLLGVLLYSISNVFGAVKICDSNPCFFSDVKQQDILICGCNVNNCLINLMGNVGKDTLVISFAHTTTVVCNGIDTCAQAQVMLNPAGINITKVDATLDEDSVTITGPTCKRIDPKTAVFNCLKDSSCKDMVITSWNVDTTVNAIGASSYNEGVLNCMGFGTKCTLNCGDKIPTCDAATCGINCECNGLLCPDRTVSPSISPVVETDAPTVSDHPTANPTTDSPTLSPVIETDSPTLSDWPTNYPTTNSPTLSPVVETDSPTLSDHPTNYPTTSSPTVSPVVETDSPTLSDQPTNYPTTNSPSFSPVVETESPTLSAHPTNYPTTDSPTASPVVETESPTLSDQPTNYPTTNSPSFSPVVETESPTLSDQPTNYPTTNSPTASPVVETDSPTLSDQPTNYPTTDSPSFSPVVETESPTLSDQPTNYPTTDSPTLSPIVETDAPTLSDQPTNYPTTDSPTASPIVETDAPTLSDQPTNYPTTDAPTFSPVVETDAPTLSGQPTNYPTTDSPTFSPIVETDAPTLSDQPTNYPTTDAPTFSPIIETDAPTLSDQPTNYPTTDSPSFSPVVETESPTISDWPTNYPTTDSPSFSPVVETESPTLSDQPTNYPTTDAPTFSPLVETESPTLSDQPTNYPTTDSPTFSPVVESESPTLSDWPTNYPTTDAPTLSPVPETESPSTSPTTPRPSISPIGEYITCDTVVMGECTISPQGGEYVIVTGTEGVTTLTIDCSEDSQCKEDGGPLVVYSGVKNTKVLCGASNSCLGARLIMGTPPHIPAPFKSIDFAGPFHSLVCICEGKDSCKDVSLQIYGSFAMDPLIAGLGDKALDEAIIDCDVPMGQECTLWCDQDNADEPCDQTTCLNDCVRYNTTVNTTGYSLHRTSNFDYKRHRINSLILPVTIEGHSHGTIIAQNNEQQCTIDCAGPKQCSDSKIYAGCQNTIINCGEGSCLNTIIYVGELTNDMLPKGLDSGSFSGNKRSVMINCQSNNACQNSNINIIGEFEIKPLINGVKDHSLRDAIINCADASCYVECDGETVCNNIEFNCDINNKCTCHGPSCGSISSKTNINEVFIITPQPTSQTFTPTNQPTTFDMAINTNVLNGNSKTIPITIIIILCLGFIGILTCLIYKRFLSKKESEKQQKMINDINNEDGNFQADSLEMENMENNENIASA